MELIKIVRLARIDEKLRYSNTKELNHFEVSIYVDLGRCVHRLLKKGLLIF